jgi:charged multivesicular body protein 7
VLSLDDSLLRDLESKQFGRPLALGTVFSDAQTTRDILPLHNFLKLQEPIYQKSWASVPWDIVTWGLRQVGITGTGLGWGGQDAIPKGDFVVLANLEAAAKAFTDVAAERTSPFERTFSRAHFSRTFNKTLLGGQEQLSNTDLEVLTRFLSRDKNLIATDGNTIRIKTSADEASTITEEDSAIASLKELMEDLTKQTSALSRRVDELNIAAQDAVRRKNRVSALAALKSKKIAENTLAARHATLNQLEEVAAKIQQATDNVQMVKVMQTSTSALKSLNKQTGGADKVDEVLENLREQMGEVDEVGNIIAEAQGAAVVDEAEVDDELESMLAEERKKDEEIERKRKEEVDRLQAAKEAEEAKKRLAELEKLESVPAENPGQTRTETDQEIDKVEEGPLTPASATAQELDKMHIDMGEDKQDKVEHQDERVQVPAE